MVQRQTEPNICGVYTTDADGRHDGFVEVFIGVNLNYRGESALQKFCVPKVKNLDSVFATEHKTVKFVAKPKPSGGTWDEAELVRIAKSAIKAMKTWLSELDELKVDLLTSSLSKSQLQAAMASHSLMPAYGSTDNNYS